MGLACGLAAKSLWPQMRNITGALAGVVQIESGPGSQRVTAGSFPSQGRSPCGGRDPQEEVLEMQPHIAVSSLSFSIPSPL